MVQDIAPKHLKNEFRQNKTAGPDDIIFHFNPDGVLVKDTGSKILFPRKKELLQEAPMLYVFAVDDVDYYMVKGETLAMPEGWEYRKIREIRGTGRMEDADVYAAMTAEHLAHWYRDNAYCGRCGGETRWAPDERALDCTKCGRRIYPRINPAVIVGVTDGDRILMTKYANRPFTDFALIAGFTEIGETLEETVKREVMEEAGLKVRNIRYYKSQPWGDADDILAGFYCDVDGDTTIHMDSEELKIAKWFRRDEVKGQQQKYSLTNEMMEVFRDGKEPKA